VRLEAPAVWEIAYTVAVPPRPVDALSRLVQRSPARGQPVTRLGALLRFLTSRAAIVTVVPGLVAAISAVLLGIGRDTLRRESLASARARLQEITDARASAVRGALGQSDPVLTELRRLVRVQGLDLAEQARAMVGLLGGRPGMAYLSASYPDGTFRGAYLDEHERLRFQESVPGRSRIFGLDDAGALAEPEQHVTSYDPRERDFYRRASATRGRLWTAPYAFYETRVTGVTRAEAVFANGPEGALLAVLTVDFDVAALSRLLTADPVPGATVVLFTRGGELLAYPPGALTDEDRARREGRPVRTADVGDPVLRAFFGGGSGRPPSSFKIDGEPFMAALSDASDDPALGWTVAYVAPERLFLGAAELYQRRGLWSFGVVVVLALGVSLAFAYGVTRTERRARAAEARAARLDTRARELGSYRLVARLGRGGMGEVWRAEHRLLAREAAIKLIRPDASPAEAAEQILRFRREAEALSQLRCRSTIEIFDYGVAADGTFFYVMELLDGLDLESLVTRFGPVSPGRAVHLLVQACASLAEAHDRGLIHRDVKPANLFLCRAADEVDIVKVLDFGLVRSVRASSGQLRPAGGRGSLEEPLTGYQQGILGTPGFMAPEQVLGRSMDGRADLYALGCVAFWLLTGRLLFDDPDHARRSAACLADVADLRERLGAGVPEALFQVVKACLSRRRSERPGSARALADALRSAAATFAPGERYDPADAQRFWRGFSPSGAEPEPTSPRTLTLMPAAPESGPRG
jgi:serine/threonine protein kinase